MTFGGTDSPAVWLTLALSWLWAGVLGAAELLPCPDCGRQVSPRALMCPQCGCRGDVIEQAAKERDAKPKPRIPDAVVKADFGTRTCEALPVRMDDGLFVVLPLERVLGLETLEFSFVSTNAVIGYGLPEVALDRPLIRFPITETNLLFAAATTNIGSQLATPSAVSVGDASGWQAVPPRALKSQGRTLLEIRSGKDVRLPERAHPYFRTLADRWSGRGK